MTTDVITVSIDVADDKNLVAEASAVGCTATEITEGYRPFGTTVYHVTGPSVVLLDLIEGWGYYTEGEYTVVKP